MDDNASNARHTGTQGARLPESEQRRALISGSTYEITVAGHLDDHWAAWLGELRLAHDPDGNTVLTGVIPDQAALHGLLVQIRDLGLTLIAVVRLGGVGDDPEGGI